MEEPSSETAENKDVLKSRQAAKLGAGLASDGQAARRVALARSTAGLAHDINNLLAIVRTCAESVGDAELDERQRMAWDTVLQASVRGTALTRRLLAISRDGLRPTGVVELNDLLSSATGVLRRLVSRNVQLTVRTASVPLRVWAEAGLVDQVVFNLAQNASDAMPDGGELTLTLLAAEVVASDVLVGRLSPGRYAVLSVRDTGVGMDAATRERIFEAFFSTKTPGERAGLGLAVVEDAVHDLRGAIHVESSPKRGSEFRVYLPLRP